MYLSHGVLGGVFPHLPNAAYPTFTTAPFSLLLNASYPIPMAYYDNINDASIHFTSSVPEGLEAYRFPSQMPTTENASDADIYSTSSVHGELEAYPILCQMSATENISDTICTTSFVPGELEAYPFPGQMSATEDVSFQADHTLIDPWSMAEQPGLLASSTTGFGATASYGTYTATVQVVDWRLTRVSRVGGFHFVRPTRQRL